MRHLPLILMLLAALTGCQRPPMTVPGVFASGKIDPLADVPEAERTNAVTLFFATDRVYDESKNDWRQYTRLRSSGLDLGTIEIAFGPDDAWPSIVAATRGRPGGERHRPRIEQIDRLGKLARTTIAQPNVKPAPTNEPIPPSPDAFVSQLNQALERSAGKDITVYIHGFKVGFAQGALTAAEYDLYTGGLGPFILYSWPSYNSLFEYSHDRDSVRYTTAHARQFFEFLADQINAGKLDAETIHVLAHSTGAEVIGSVLRELALMSRELTPDQRRAKWRIGSVLLIAPDISVDVARERVLKEDLRGMYEQIVVYSSLHDRALDWAARVLYRTARLGSVREDDFSEQDRYWLSQAADVALIDSDSAPYHGFVNHSHHRFSPAVSSDVILCLRSSLGPAQRGLVREPGQVLWRFADDYPQRATEAARRVYGPPAQP
ncbi:MAG: alpha/beta hydrolase [Phycisphaeraceae bacterium]